MRALQVLAHGCAELPQRERHQRRAAIHRRQRPEHHLLQPTDVPDPQMRLAPLGVNARRHVVPIDVTSEDELDRHDPEQAGEGHDEPDEVQREGRDDELREAAGREECLHVNQGERADEGYEERRIQESREEDLQSGEVSDGEHLCRALVALSAGLAEFHRSGRRLGGLLERARAVGDLPHCVAVTEQRPDRHHPSCSLQFLRQASDEDRVPPASVNPSSNPSGVEQGAADRQHLLALGAGAFGSGQFGNLLPFVRRIGRRILTRVFRFRLGASQEMSQIWQALPVDFSRDGLHDEFLDKEDPRRDRRRRKLLGEGRRHARGPLRGR